MMMTGENTAGGHTVPNPESDTFDDMRDGEDIANWPDPLGQVISYVHAALFETYTRYDTLSIEKQKRHKIFSGLAVVFGTTAIILAILQVFLKFISHEGGAEGVKIFELISFLVALFAVVVAVGSNLHKGWLKQRYLAEQCRSLKFRALIHPYLWYTPDISFPERFALWKKQFNKRVSAVKSARTQTGETWLMSNEMIRPPHDTCGFVFDVSSLSTLTDYYVTKRLQTQLDYFQARDRYFNSIDQSTGWIPNFCFIAGIMSAVIHFAIDLFFPPGNPGLEFTSTFFLMLTLMFPIFAIGVRTLRSSVEVSRSASLFRAKAQALEHFKTRLDEELAQNAVPWAKILSILWECENFFENENQEWLRMLSEAEWFL